MLNRIDTDKILVTGLVAYMGRSLADKFNSRKEDSP